MTPDPVRLLAQDDDPFSASLLKAARDGDAATARTRKVAVLGAAGGAAFGGATLAAAKLSSKSAWTMIGTKWLAFGVLFAGGLGVTVAALWPDTPPAPLAPVATEPAAAPLAQLAPPSPSDQTANQAPSAPSDQTANQLPSAPSDQTANQAPSGASSQTASPPPSGPSDQTAPDETPAAQKPLATAAARSSAPTDPPVSTATQPASSPPTTAANPAPPADAASELAAEVAALRSAREALGRGQPQKCLEAVNAYFASFPRGHLSAEARLLRIEAMAAAGQRAQAAALARSMLAQSPRSPYAARLRALAGEPSTP